MINREGKFEQKIIYLLIVLAAAFYLLPFVLFGSNSIVSIHDNLDSNVSWYKMFRDNGLFLKFDAPSTCLSEMSTLYYSQVGFTFQSLLYMVFNDFAAYTLSKYFSIFAGCISMYILLKKTFGFSSNVSVFSAVCYAVLPVIPVWNIAVGTLPLIITVFFHLARKTENVFSWKVLLLLFFPFFSSFATFGFFILGFWFLGLVVCGVKNRKINFNLLAGFFALLIGYILVDLRLFYMMLILRTPLNRSIFTRSPTDSIAGIKGFLNFLKYIGIYGHYHASSMQDKIILPLAFVVSLISVIALITGNKQPGMPLAKMKARFSGISCNIKLLFLVEFIVLIIYCITALYESEIMNAFIAKYIPLLGGFNYGRVYILNRVLWYVIFAVCIEKILKIGIIKIDIRALQSHDSDSSAAITLGIRLPRLSAAVIVFLQLGYIMSYTHHYSDQCRTWFNELVIKTGIAKKIMPGREFSQFISYKEFFAEKMFNEIKKDISYSGERVAAFGYHPAVLMYNGFHAIDGYNSAYPLSYMRRFRTLIVPELEINPWAKAYYDAWGGRMYLYNTELSYMPTRNKVTVPVNLNIDMEIFKNEFDGKYIFSRAEISNSGILGLELIRRYYDDESIYTIYAYRCK